MSALEAQQGRELHDRQQQTERPRLYTVRKSASGGKAFWTRIGSAWLHKDGKGFNITLDALPVDGRVVLRGIGGNGETIDPETGEVLEADEIPF